MTVKAYLIDLISRKLITHVVLDSMDDIPPENHIFLEIPTMFADDGTIFETDTDVYSCYWNNDKKTFVDGVDNIINLSFNGVDMHNERVANAKAVMEKFTNTHQLPPKVY
jgi:hypothetical protein